ncbi:hypothetical protein H6P81_005397 [Aristolochia fimbriata]|uniref:Uncharacterized protein n=1 Tax=Aristolochia fimbriata TaxID=158543 RepID=A0AAV7EYU7_ARIFI|nr:hypothetical protein H6P81_005397 [Aristolochia fimbriata]
MAAVSTLPSNNSSDTGATTATPIVNGGTPPRRSAPSDTPRQNLRGLNKPKCSKCGNVARSRCPYQSCKSCCAKAQNPCHIHVLKSNSILPDKSPSVISSLDQNSTDTSPSGTSIRVSTLRQIPNNFVKLVGAQGSVRARRPLSRKDAATINSWRFSKLKEYNERNIEAESEAFDRYMQNVSLLEEAFPVKSEAESHSLGNEDMTGNIISEIKVKVRANALRAENFRQRIQGLVDRGLAKLRKWEMDDEVCGPDGSTDQKELKKPRRAEKTEKWADRATAVNELIDKLNKARTEDDLKSCLEMKSRLFNCNAEAESSKLEVGESKISDTADGPHSGESSKSWQEPSAHFLPKLVRTIVVNQETLANIESHLLSLGQLPEL